MNMTEITVRAVMMMLSGSAVESVADALTEDYGMDLEAALEHSKEVARLMEYVEVFLP